MYACAACDLLKSLLHIRFSQFPLKYNALNANLTQANVSALGLTISVYVNVASSQIDHFPRTAPCSLGHGAARQPRGAHLRQHSVQPLQRPVEVQFDPARRRGDRLASGSLIYS